MTYIIIGFFCLILLIANRAQSSPVLRSPLYVCLMLVNGALVLNYGITPAFNWSPRIHVSQQTGLIALAASLIFAGAATALLFLPVRLRLAPIFPAAMPKQKYEASDRNEVGFDPTSLPQMTALVFCVYLLAEVVLQYILAGGLGGLASGFEAPTVLSIIEQAATFVLIAFLGVGIPTRRTFLEGLDRLGLRWPTLEELAIALLVSAALVVLSMTVGILWQIVTPSQLIDEQTKVSRLLSDSVATLTFAFVVAAGAAIGEEIAFRGGLQSVFGLWPTAIFFALTHIQYTLTPATLIIIGVAVGFGWLRKRYNTTAAIVAHFSYDFVLLALPLYARYMQDVLKGTLR